MVDEPPQPKTVIVKRSELAELINNPENLKLITDKLHNRRTMEQEHLHNRASARTIRQAAVQHRTVVGQQHDVMTAVFKTFGNVYELMIDFLVSESIPRTDMWSIVKGLKEKGFIERHWMSILGLSFFSVIFITLGFSPNATSIGFQVLNNIYAQVVIAVFSILIVVLAFKSLNKKRGEAPSAPY